ncbi:hypothetical protein [Arthrobacter sp. SLBN-53]|uniref:hypothetical protein n=1 Tax=Arthrobacter sp. SLBN-53 TaxID=2768412 RepID=UPI0011500D1D|nr:hypothetical protein [Arthrobacter sp. SLBN-53]TQK32070.1 hypothetical protein FBY28_5119 [Arthrobacter sp. SLBN-53]
MADPTAPPRRRRLTQKPAAFALGLGILAVPLIPVTANAVLPDRDWSADAEEVTPVELTTDGGEQVAVDVMDGWQIIDSGSSVVMHADGSVVMIQAYDRMDRDPAAVAQRLMRANRLEGVSAALDGGVISGNGATLSGDTCVAVTTDTTGTCAFLYDDDVVVSVIALTGPESQGPDIETIAGLISRETQQ